MNFPGDGRVSDPLQLSGNSGVPPLVSIPETVAFIGVLSSFVLLHSAPAARTSVHGTLEPAIKSWLNVCAADQGVGLAGGGYRGASHGQRAGNRRASRNRQIP